MHTGATDRRASGHRAASREDDGEASSRMAIDIGAPVPTDGAGVHDLIAACPPLDPNSLYANLLQCSHFSETCAIAKSDDEPVGWVSGYIVPGRPDIYFLWQVAVSSKARGQALPKRLVADILRREACKGVRYIHTTITPDNEASWGLFRSIARWLEAPLEDAVLFEREAHFKGRHDSETLVRIGPFGAIPPT